MEEVSWDSDSDVTTLSDDDEPPTAFCVDCVMAMCVVVNVDVVMLADRKEDPPAGV